MYVGKEKRKDFLEGRKDREMGVDPSFSYKVCKVELHLLGPCNIICNEKCSRV